MKQLARFLMLVLCWTACSVAQEPENGIVNPVEPLDPGEQASREETKSEAGNIEFNGEDLQEVLRKLALQANVNMAVSDVVEGTITLRLTDVSPIKAIDIITKSKGLSLDVIDGVYYIKTPAEYAAAPIDMIQLLKTESEYRGLYYKEMLAGGVPEEVARGLCSDPALLDRGRREQISSAPANSGSGTPEKQAAGIQMQKLDLNGQVTVFACLAAAVGWIPETLVHLLLGVFVWLNARKLRRAGGRLQFGPAWLWGATVLISGLLGLAVYWGIHHSNLARRESLS